jgi:hypothetical protein
MPVTSVVAVFAIATVVTLMAALTTLAALSALLITIIVATRSALAEIGHASRVRITEVSASFRLYPGKRMSWQ